MSMSGQIGGQLRTLPFTGLAALPLILIALVVIGLGVLLTKVVPKKNYELG
jgi:hypothetical protein